MMLNKIAQIENEISALFFIACSVIIIYSIFNYNEWKDIGNMYSWDLQTRD